MSKITGANQRDHVPSSYKTIRSTVTSGRLRLYNNQSGKVPVRTIMRVPAPREITC